MFAYLDLWLRQRY